MKITVILASLLIGALQSQAMEWPDGQITFHVENESGKPLANVAVETVVFDQSKPPATYKVVTSTTDIRGFAVVNTPNIAKEYSYIVRGSNGYYSSGGLYKFVCSTNGQWLPWNPTVKIILKPIGVRVPMYARTVGWETSLPENNRAIGYDLEIGDWVTPYGNGITSDFVFTLERKSTSVTQDFNATLTLTFHNDGDGIQSIMSDSSGSSFRIPRSAPEDGYDSKVVLQMHREDGKPMVGVLTNPDQNYFFRIRTKKDERGNIVSAKYGKIYGGMGWDIFHSQTAQLQFTYYFNPEPSSRNMEFNPKMNLSKNLKFNEGVNAP